MPAQPATQEALHALFHPRAVAVIGASDDTTKHGYIVLTNVRDTGFRGGIYGISRRLKDVDGIPCFPDLAACPNNSTSPSSPSPPRPRCRPSATAPAPD